MSTMNLMKRFNLEGPLVVAPMAGGPSTPALVAAASNAGALGSLGLAYLSPENIQREIQKVRAGTKRSFAVNLFVPAENPPLAPEQIAAALAVTRRYRDELGLPDPAVRPPFTENFDDQFAAVLRERPDVLSFTFGLLPPRYLAACREAGILTIGTATTVEEGIAVEESGVDAVVAQGTEAGGHRGIFSTEAEEPGIHALALASALASRLRIPVIAAGGIMDGKGIAAALRAGAQAAQLGTAFLLCEEAGTSPAYRAELEKPGAKATRLTRAFSGRIARGLVNRFMREMSENPGAILPFPAQNSFTRDMRNQAGKRNDASFLSLWAGTGVAEIRKMDTASLVKTLFRETAEEMGAAEGSDSKSAAKG